MKKRYIILIVLVALAAIIFTTLKIAPSVVKNYIVTHSEELIGRKLNIGDVSLNPFTFTVTVDSFAIYEQDAKIPFVSFDKFRINVNPTKLLTKEINVSEIYLKGLYAHAVQNGDKFNFSDILEKFASKDSLPKTQQDSTKTLDLNPSKALGGIGIVVTNITFEKGNIIYEDTKVNSKIYLQDFSLAIPAVYFNEKDTDVGVNLKFADGGDLGVNVLFNINSQDFGIDISLSKFALSVAKPYMNDFIDYKDFSGSLDAKLNISGNVNEILASTVKGSVSLNNIVLTETSDKTLGVNYVNVGIDHANLKQMDFLVDSVIVDGAFAHLDLLKNGKTNLDALLKPIMNKKSIENNSKDSINVATTDSTNLQKSAPLKFIVNKLKVTNTTVNALDNTPKIPFTYKVSNISVNANNLNLNTPCTVNVTASFPEGGSMSLKYKGAISDLSTMDAYISVKNLALKHFSPYSHHYTGYPISSGTMAFASDNKMHKFNIESKNTIDIYNINVSDKDPNTSPEYTVPMKIGLYILKDKDDKIQFDVPVKGNIKDPEFSYFKIIWKTVVNLLVKVAISPLRLVGNVASAGAGAMGFDVSNDDEIIIDALSETFGSEQYERAQKMTLVVEKDPKLKINLVQYFNLKKTIEAYKTLRLKTDFYKSTQNKTVLNELDLKNIEDISESDSAYVAYKQANETILDQKSLEKELLELAKKRDADMLNVLRQQPGVTKKNVTIRTAKRAELIKHKGKAMYKVEVDVQ